MNRSGAFRGRTSCRWRCRRPPPDGSPATKLAGALRRRGRRHASWSVRRAGSAGGHRRRTAQTQLRHPPRSPASPISIPVASTIPFADGHTRQAAGASTRVGPFLGRPPRRGRISTRLGEHTAAQLKQAVISASALSLLYPAGGIQGYSQEAFLDDLVREALTDIRACLEAGAYNVQIDFTEARLSVKLDPSRALLRQFVALNNRVQPVLSPGPAANRCAHVPGRRPRCDSQRGCGLRGSPAGLV